MATPILHPVHPFAIARYLGLWYEIARIDYRYEKNLDHVTAEYSKRSDGLISVRNRGFNTKQQKWKESLGKAKFSGDPQTGSLKVSFFLFFYAGYHIISLDDNYHYALVAGDSTDYLWILSREKTIPSTVRDGFLDLAKSIGYDITRLHWIDQE